MVDIQEEADQIGGNNRKEFERVELSMVKEKRLMAQVGRVRHRVVKSLVGNLRRSLRVLHQARHVLPSRDREWLTPDAVEALEELSSVLGEVKWHTQDVLHRIELYLEDAPQHSGVADGVTSTMIDSRTCNSSSLCEEGTDAAG